MPPNSIRVRTKYSDQLIGKAARLAKNFKNGQSPCLSREKKQEQLTTEARSILTKVEHFLNMITSLQMRIDDLNGVEIGELLAEHLRCMAEVSPLQSRHALNLDGLRQPDITFWSAWQHGELVGCGALKELDGAHGEIKSMRTAADHMRKGVGSFVLQHIISEAKRRDYRRLSLETGSMPYFAPAHALYEKFGFERCAPFADYRKDPNSVFMTRAL